MSEDERRPVLVIDGQELELGEPVSFGVGDPRFPIHRAPTAEECDENRLVRDEGDEITFAAWHPQWGGYVGKCWVATSRAEGLDCFDVENWHDGEFPSETHRTVYHYCATDQLRRFADVVERMQGTASS